VALRAIWPFRRKRTVDAETAAWLVENMEWLIREFGGRDGLQESTLVLPKPGFFAFEGEQGHALALRLFEQVKAYCGMSDWEVDLIPDDNPLAAGLLSQRQWLSPKDMRSERLGWMAIESKSLMPRRNSSVPIA
jgi:hypothetical protein